ncbi:MAG: hypothetical protein MPN21_08135 [Thermoanaerobaculia bacterium]|nr:hypothetical protein [Thermoanaerobaculia bacterium]
MNHPLRPGIVPFVAVLGLLLSAAAVGQPQPYDPNDAIALPPAVDGQLVPIEEGGATLLNPSFEMNGGVGTNVFTDWTVVDVPGSIGGLPSAFGSIVAQTGVTSPVSSSAVEAPTDGTFSAMADATGPSASLIYQDFVVPSGTTTVRCDVYINNQAGVFINAGTLDWEAVANQHARLDIMDPLAPDDDVGAGVLLNLFITNPGDPAVQSYQTISADISAFAGQTVRLRAAEVDNQFFFNMGLDNCSVTSSGGEPVVGVPMLDARALGILLILLALTGIAVLRR